MMNYGIGERENLSSTVTRSRSRVVFPNETNLRLIYFLATSRDTCSLCTCM